MSCDPAETKDWASGASSWVLLWGTPAFIMLLVAFSTISGEVRGMVWGASLSVMGVACLANARRCGRVHCYLTGPFFLAMAITSLVQGLLGYWPEPDAWRWLGLGVLGGGAFLHYVPERLWGKYASR